MSEAITWLWRRVRGQVVADAGHLHSEFFPEEDRFAMTPNGSYLRVWLSELFLARQTSWGRDRSPAVRAEIRLPFGDQEPRTFTRLVRPEVTSAHGVFEDFDLTGLLPYRGGTVGTKAELHQILRKNHLGTAIDVVTGFSSLLAPLSAALAIANQVATGIDMIIKANAQDPVLSVERTSAAPGGGGQNELRPGYLVVVRATEDELPAKELRMENGRLACSGGRLTGFDYMVLRVEGRQERDDWRVPDLDTAIRDALVAKASGRSDEYESLRAEAVSMAWTSAILTPLDRKRVAKAVREELDTAVLGAAADGELTVATIVGRGLPSRDSVVGLTLADLLAAAWPSSSSTT